MIEKDITRVIKLLRKLYFLAYTDPLTKCLNRRGLFEKVKDLGIFQKGKIKERRKENYALILIDVNKFKSVNDNYGYQTGDKLLKIVAQELKKNFRQKDIVSRFGGDEFLLIVTEIEETILKEKLKNIKNLIDKKLEKYGSGISIAYEMFSYGANFSKIFKEANKKLQKIKYGR